MVLLSAPKHASPQRQGRQQRERVEEGLGALSAADMRKLERNVAERFGGGSGAYY